MLEVHWIRKALAFAAAKAGSSMAANMAMMAMTTRSSIKVNPHFEDPRLALFPAQTMFALGLAVIMGLIGQRLTILISPLPLRTYFFPGGSGGI